MRTKFIEIRDSATFIPALALEISADDGYLARRAGFVSPVVVLVKLQPTAAEYDPYAWGGRTMPVAHEYVQKHFDELQDSDVVDVQFILGETIVKKRSEEDG